MDYLLLVSGLALLVKGVDWVVDSSAKFAQHLGVPAFIIGLTLVALGTSAPETVIGILSGLKGANQITLGDVIGSSIINISLIIGVTAVIYPLQVDPLVSRREIPLSFLVQLVLAAMLLTGLLLSRGESILLLAGMLVFITYIIYKTNRLLDWNRPEDAGEKEVFDFLQDQEVLSAAAVGSEETEPKLAAIERMPALRLLLFFLLGLAAMISGAQLVVNNGIAIAHNLGLGEEFIGLTIVAFGTSLPELVTCVVAALRQKSDIAVGNIIGSNISNILLVLGLSGTIHPIVAHPTVLIDLAAMLLATLFLALPAWFKQNISRLTGIILMAFYFAYMAFKLLSLG